MAFGQHETASVLAARRPALQAQVVGDRRRQGLPAAKDAQLHDNEEGSAKGVQRTEQRQRLLVRVKCSRDSSRRRLRRDAGSRVGSSFDRLQRRTQV